MHVSEYHKPTPLVFFASLDSVFGVSPSFCSQSHTHNNMNDRDKKNTFTVAMAILFTLLSVFYAKHMLLGDQSNNVYMLVLRVMVMIALVLVVMFFLIMTIVDVILTNPEEPQTMGKLVQSGVSNDITTCRGDMMVWRFGALYAPYILDKCRKHSSDFARAANMNFETYSMTLSATVKNSITAHACTVVLKNASTEMNFSEKVDAAFMFAVLEVEKERMSETV